MLALIAVGYARHVGKEYYSSFSSPGFLRLRSFFFLHKNVSKVFGSCSIFLTFVSNVRGFKCGCRFFMRRTSSFKFGMSSCGVVSGLSPFAN